MNKLYKIIKFIFHPAVCASVIAYNFGNDYQIIITFVIGGIAGLIYQNHNLK